MIKSTEYNSFRVYHFSYWKRCEGSRDGFDSFIFYDKSDLAVRSFCVAVSHSKEEDRWSGKVFIFFQGKILPLADHPISEPEGTNT